MKRIITLVLLLTIILSSFAATAGPASPYVIPGTLKRPGSAFVSEYAANVAIPGESPTTGLPLEDQIYMPILAQIDNNLGGIPQWGIASADIMYETPIQGGGWTRLTALFSDRYPDEVGPIRSARVMHVDLREEWDAVFVNYGKQEEGGSDAKQVLIDYGVNKKGLAIDGIGNAYKDYFFRVKYHMAPHNVTVYLKKLREYMLEKEYPFPIRPYKFSDDPQYIGIAAIAISIDHKGNQDTVSDFIYHEDKGGYLRYTAEGIYYDLLDPATELVYSNIIVQRTKLAYNNSSLNPILPDVVGNGACDIFIRGKYIAGNWVRNSLNERTVFLDENGNETILARGKTWVIITDENTAITIRSTDDTSVLPVLNESMTLAEEPPVFADTLLILERGIEETKADEKQKDSTSISGNAVDDVEQSDEVNMGLTEKSAETFVNDTVTGKMFATVTTPNKGALNFRESESIRSELISKIKNNTLVQVLSIGDDWTKILYDGKEGYVMSVYLDFSAQ